MAFRVVILHWLLQLQDIGLQKQTDIMTCYLVCNSSGQIMQWAVLTTVQTITVHVAALRLDRQTGTL